MEIIAESTNYTHIRKKSGPYRDLIKKKNINYATAYQTYMPQKASGILKKLLDMLSPTRNRGSMWTSIICCVEL